MNPVFMIAYNTAPAQLPMTLEAIDSALAQDCGDVKIYATDNGSTDQTYAALLNYQLSQSFNASRYEHNQSPVKIANQMFQYFFRDCGYQYVLGIPNDVILPPYLYGEMLKVPRGFVCASQTEDKTALARPNEVRAVNECTPMAVMLVRRWAYEAIVSAFGYFFDEGMQHYASDCCLALRMAACGIRGVQLNLPYYHYGSASWRLASRDVAEAITSQADIDREYFRQKYGFSVDSPKYGETASDINWRG